MDSNKQKKVTILCEDGEAFIDALEELENQLQRLLDIMREKLYCAEER